MLVNCTQLIKVARNRNLHNIGFCVIMPSIMLCLRIYLNILTLYLQKQPKANDINNKSWINAIIKVLVKLFLNYFIDSSSDAMLILIKLIMCNSKVGETNLILDGLSKDGKFYVENSVISMRRWKAY